jgi:hypothetical protein
MENRHEQTAQQLIQSRLIQSGRRQTRVTSGLEGAA